MLLQINHRMKTTALIVFIILTLAATNLANAQEWKNLKTYQKATENIFLKEGCWLKKDRICNNEAWKQANFFNLKLENGSQKYYTIDQIRDFYKWFDNERKIQGHELKWIGIATIVETQLSNIEVASIRILIIRNKGVINFAHEATRLVFEYAFPKLKEVCFSDHLITGKEAESWDDKFGMNEQCVVLEPLYSKLSFKSIKRLDQMAKGKGIFRFAVSRNLRFEGNIDDCKARFNHGINKLIPYYLNNPEKDYSCK